MTQEPIHLPFIEELALFLVCAGLIVPLFKRFSVSPVLGFLLIGIAVGPFGLGRLVSESSIWNHAVIRDVATTRTIAEFGVAFLLFIIGIELSPQRLWSMRRLVFGLGGLQVALSAAAIAAVLGGCLALSSTAIVVALARAFGLPLGTAIEMGFLLGSAGEFGFVLIGVAAGAGLAPPDVQQMFLVVVGAGMVAAPLLAWAGRRLGEAAAGRQPAPPMPVDDIPALEGHFVLAGYGRVGQLLREILDAEQLTYIAVDRDERLVSEARRRGQEAFVGDASRSEFLTRLGLDAAQALVVTTDEPEANARIVTAVRAR